MRVIVNGESMLMQDLKEFAEKPREDYATQFPITKLLGRGSYSKVYRSGDIAIKIMKPCSEHDEFSIRVFNEIYVMLKLSSKYYVPLFEVEIINCHEVRLAMELMHGNLHEYLQNCRMVGKRLSKYEIVKYSFDILSALELMHARNWVHCDVKPDNFLIDKDRRLRLCDFDLTNISGTPIGEEIVACIYRAPELWWGCDIYKSDIDMWSAGCIIYSMVHSEGPFDVEDYNVPLHIVNSLGAIVGLECICSFCVNPSKDFPESELPNITTEFAQSLIVSDFEFLTELLKYGRRATASEVLKYPCFSEYL